MLICEYVIFGGLLDSYNSRGIKMRKFIIYFIILAGMVLAQKTEIKFIRLYKGNKDYDVVKPVFIGGKFKKINVEIDSITPEFYKETMKECMEYNMKSYCESFKASMESKILYQDDKIISLIIEVSEKTGGIHPVYFISSFVINKESGENIKDQILGDEREEVTERIYKYILENPFGTFWSKDDSYFNQECIKDSCFTLIKKDKETVYIMYHVYDIASFGEGEQYFEFNMRTKKLYYLNGFYSLFIEKGEKIEIE